MINIEAICPKRPTSHERTQHYIKSIHLPQPRQNNRKPHFDINNLTRSLSVTRVKVRESKYIKHQQPLLTRT